MSSKKLILLILLILLALLMAIAISGNLSIPSVMDIYNCTEMFSRYDVDAEVAQQNVPSKWEVKVNSEGEATLLVMVQKCEKMVLDNLINVGAVGMSHNWIELEGPEEFVTPLAGTTRSLPTRYWYIMPHQLDNRIARALFGLVNVDAQYVEKISFEDDQIDTRLGEVKETSSAESNYNWKETYQLFPEADIVTGSQRFFRQYGGRESEAFAKCESHFLGDSQVILENSASSTVGSLGFGKKLEGYSNPVFVTHCHVNYQVHFFR